MAIKGHAPAEVHKLANSVDGWLSDREIDLLYSLAINAQDGCIVEIGSYKGKSTICLAKGSLANKGVKIYAIDPHEGSIEQKFAGERSSYVQFEKNISSAGVKQIITPIVSKSETAAKNWSEPISVLWIDGDHTYRGAKLDYVLFSPHLIDGGTIAFNDATQNEVPKVVLEALSKPGWVDIGIADATVYATKRPGKRKSIGDHIALMVIKYYDVFRRVPGAKKAKRAFKSIVAKL